MGAKVNYEWELRFGDIWLCVDVPSGISFSFNMGQVIEKSLKMKLVTEIMKLETEDESNNE